MPCWIGAGVYLPDEEANLLRVREHPRDQISNPGESLGHCPKVCTVRKDVCRVAGSAYARLVRMSNQKNQADKDKALTAREVAHWLGGGMAV